MFERIEHLAGSNETKANSAQFQVKLPTGAELGKNVYILFCLVFFTMEHNFKSDTP